MFRKDIGGVHLRQLVCHRSRHELIAATAFFNGAGGLSGKVNPYCFISTFVMYAETHGFRRRPPGDEMPIATPRTAPTMADDTPTARDKRMARDYFFPTPVYHTDLAQAPDFNARLVTDIRAWRERDPGGTFRSNTPQLGGWHSATDMHLRAEFTELTSEIFELLHGVFTDQGYDDDYEPVCDSMWANINPHGAFNRHHTHPHALWSGVYYVRTPDDCGLLCLTDPRPQAHVITPYLDPKRRSAHTWAEVYYQPVAGRLIAFPGWLVHSTHPNLASVVPESGETANDDGNAGGERAAPEEVGGQAVERISVSFNFRQRRRGIGRAAAPANEVVRADLLAR